MFVSFIFRPQASWLLVGSVIFNFGPLVPLGSTSGLHMSVNTSPSDRCPLLWSGCLVIPMSHAMLDVWVSGCVLELQYGAL